MELLPRIEAHLKATGTPVTLFGRRVARDPRLVIDMRRGREPGASMRRRIETYLSGGAN